MKARMNGIGGAAGWSDAPAGGVSVAASACGALRMSGVRESRASATMPRTPGTVDAICGAPPHASAYIAAAISAPVTTTIGRLRRSALSPPCMCATSMPLATMIGAKSSAMCGAMTSPSMPVTSWMV